MRNGVTIAILALLAAGISAAGTSAARADDKCGPLVQVNTVQMLRETGSARDLVPFGIGGIQKNFLFDTGGSLTQIRPGVADELKLSIHQGRRGLIDVNGNMSRDEATIPHFTLGLLHGDNINFMISTSDERHAKEGVDGIYALDYMGAYDTDVDFGTDTLNFFSPEHCPGGVIYWKAAAVTVIPMTLDGYHIVVPVTLDGHEINAVIDTGADDTVLRMDDAQILFGLTMGTPDTPEAPPINGDTSVTTYSHIFKSMTFGDISITNAHALIFPDVSGRHQSNAQLASNRAYTDQSLVKAPELVIGMNVLRKLHIYMAFKERQMYISPASAPAPAAMPVTASTPAPAP